MKRSDLTRKVSDFCGVVESLIYVDNTIEEALASLRQKKIGHKIIYFYVIDQEGKLLGVVPTRKLLLGNPKSHIREIMEYSLVRICADQTMQEAMELFAKHKLLALPVVERNGKLLGVIDVDLYLDESFEIVSAQRQSDIFQMIGLSLEEGKKRSVWKNYTLRMPWIFCNLAGGLVCALISRGNELVLGKTLLLAMFIPLVLTLSESVSMQSMTQTLHLLKMAHPYGRKRSFKEWRIAALIALSSALLVGLLSLLWGGGVKPSFIIGGGILLSILISSGISIMLPLFLHKTHLDPKVASGPVVLMLTDVLTTALYLSLASLFLL
jgi:magnesium transporter